jgi:hypothetical protein
MKNSLTRRETRVSFRIFDLCRFCTVVIIPNIWQCIECYNVCVMLKQSRKPNIPYMMTCWLWVWTLWISSSTSRDCHAGYLDLSLCTATVEQINYKVLHAWDCDSCFNEHGTRLALNYLRSWRWSRTRCVTICEEHCLRHIAICHFCLIVNVAVAHLLQIDVMV